MKWKLSILLYFSFLSKLCAPWGGERVSVREREREPQTYIRFIGNSRGRLLHYCLREFLRERKNPMDIFFWFGVDTRDGEPEIRCDAFNYFLLIFFFNLHSSWWRVRKTGSGVNQWNDNFQIFFFSWPQLNFGKNRP